MTNKVFFTRPNNEQEASEEEVIRFEKSALADVHRGRDVYIIEQFPRKFFGYATKIRLEKVIQPVATLSELSNSRLYRVVSTHNIYE